MLGSGSGPAPAAATATGGATATARGTAAHPSSSSLAAISDGGKGSSRRIPASCTPSRFLERKTESTAPHLRHPPEDGENNTGDGPWLDGLTVDPERLERRIQKWVRQRKVKEKAPRRSSPSHWRRGR